jgi:hypothetical protein
MFTRPIHRVMVVIATGLLTASPTLRAQNADCLVDHHPPLHCAPSDAVLVVAEANTAESSAVPGEQPGVFDIVVKNGRLVSKRRILVVHRNDNVTLHITSDAPNEFHLHGYNLLVELVPGKTATLHFRANLTGRFTYELHKTELELGALEVYP